MNQIIRKIRKNYILDTIKAFFPASLFISISIVMLLIGLTDERSFIFPSLLMILLSVFPFVQFIRNLKIAINPLKSDVFKKYGSPNDIARIYKEICQSIEYEDNVMTISQHYICNKKRPEILVACQDVLAIHKLVHKTNFATDYFKIIITDKYAKELSFTYKDTQGNLVNQLLLSLLEKCPNAVAGYNQAAFDHIAKNKVSLNNSIESHHTTTKFRSHQ